MFDTPPRKRRDVDAHPSTIEKDKRPALLKRQLSVGAEWEWPLNIPDAVAFELLQTHFPAFLSNCTDVSLRWRSLGEQLTCSICRFTLHRPVDVAGCGHFVCRSHVLDIYQNLYALRCPLCRAERPALHQVSIDDAVACNELLFSKIQLIKAHIHDVSVAACLSAPDSPLQDRFNALFFANNDF